MLLPETYRSPRGLTVEGASPELLVELLDALAFETKRAGAPLNDVLQPGVSRQYVQDQLGTIGLTAPEELIAWWGWRNGARPGLVSGQPLDMNSVEMAIHLYPRRFLGDGEFSWHPDWIRLLGPGGYAISVNTDPSEQPPAIRATESFIGTAPDNTATQVVSLCTPVTWWLLARAKGWTRWEVKDGFGRWNPDLDRYPLEWRITEIADC